MYKFITTVFTTSMVGGSIFYLIEKIKNRKQQQHDNTYMYVDPIVHAIPGFIWGGYTGVVLYSLTKIRIPEVISNYMIKNDFSSILAKK